MALISSLVSPKGGRNSLGTRWLMSVSTHCVLAISWNTDGWVSVGRCGWVKVWFPTHIRARRSARTWSG